MRLRWHWFNALTLVFTPEPYICISLLSVQRALWDSRTPLVERLHEVRGIAGRRCPECPSLFLLFSWQTIGQVYCRCAADPPVSSWQLGHNSHTECVPKVIQQNYYQVKNHPCGNPFSPLNLLDSVAQNIKGKKLLLFLTLSYWSLHLFYKFKGKISLKKQWEREQKGWMKGILSSLSIFILLFMCVCLDVCVCTHECSCPLVARRVCVFSGV